MSALVEAVEARVGSKALAAECRKGNTTAVLDGTPIPQAAIESAIAGSECREVSEGRLSRPPIEPPVTIARHARRDRRVSRSPEADGDPGTPGRSSRPRSSRRDA